MDQLEQEYHPPVPKNLTLADVSMEELEMLGQVLRRISQKVADFEATWSKEQARLHGSIITIQKNLKEIEVSYEEDQDKAEEKKKDDEFSDSDQDSPSPEAPDVASALIEEMRRQEQAAASDPSTNSQSATSNPSDPTNGNSPEEPQGDQLLFLAKAKKDRTHKKYAPVPPELFFDKNAKINCIQRFREQVYFTMHDENYSKFSYGIFIVVMTLIMISTVTFVLETIPALKGAQAFVYFEMIISISFTVEYLSRILCVRAPCSYFWEVMNFIDFLAVAPFYLQILIGFDGGFLRMIRVVRLTRLSRLRKSAMVSDNTEVLQNTLIKTMEAEFGVIFALILLEVLVMSALVYAFESESNPLFYSIPAAMWWCFVTITTVGYGDVSPITPIGQVVGVITAFSGVVVVAIIIIIITSNFNAIYKDFTIAKRKKARFKKLGKKSKPNQGVTEDKN